MRAHRFFSVHFFQYFSKSLNLFAHRITGAQQGGQWGASTPPPLRNYSVTVHLHFLQVILIDCTFMYSRSIIKYYTLFVFVFVSFNSDHDNEEMNKFEA